MTTSMEANRLIIDECRAGMRDLLYVRGIIRSRVRYVNEATAIDLLRRTYTAGAEIEHLKAIARNSTSWSHFQVQLEEIIEEAQ